MNASRVGDHRRYDILLFIFGKRSIVVANELNGFVGIGGRHLFIVIMLVNVLVISLFAGDRGYGRRLLVFDCGGFSDANFIDSRYGQLMRLIYRWHWRKWWHRIEVIAQMQLIRWHVHRGHMANGWMFALFVVIAVAVFGLFQLHSVAIWIDIALTMFASFFDEYLLSIHGANKAFVRAYVSTFCVYVNDIVFLPLAQALIFPFCKYFEIFKNVQAKSYKPIHCGKLAFKDLVIFTVRYLIVHDVERMAFRPQFGTQSASIWKQTFEFPIYRARCHG